MISIGKAYWAVVQYYDCASSQMKFKKRPIIVIGRADKNDFVVLPISSITKRYNRSVKFDYQIEPMDYPELKLKHTSFIRTHKQTVLHDAEIVSEICDFKKEYEEAFLEIIARVSEFQEDLVNSAL